MLILPNGRLTDAMVGYLADVQPRAGGPSDQLVNHGWILGDVSRVAVSAQADIDLLLEARSQ